MQSLLNALQKGALVVTPNQRLNHTLKQLFFQAFPQKVQPHPHCLPYASFLAHCYELLTYQQPFTDHPSLLKPHQTQFLWQQVIGEPVEPTLSHQSLAAWQDCQLYRVPLNDPQFAYNTQTQVFQAWGLKFEQKLKQGRLITPAQLMSYLSTHTLKLPYPRVIFACFDHFNPDQMALQQWLRLACEIDTYDLSPDTQQTFVFAAEDEKNEQAALFDWLTQALPHADSIGVVVPELSSQAASLNYALKLRFPDLPIHLSLGQPLAQAPMVSHALAWLQLSRSPLAHDTAKLLLHSPFLKDADNEFEARARFMSRTPLLQARQFPFRFFTQALKPQCPKLAELLLTLPSYPKQDTPTNWAMHFINRLIHCGFPGAVALNSTTYQTYQRLLSLFDAFKELSLVCPQLTRAQALKYFKQLTHDTIFQAEMQEKPKIQVLGLLEAAGLPFEKLWIMGLTDRCLPSHSMPSPFIPLALQRTHRLPHTHLEHETKLAEIRLRRFQHASQETILSYAIGSELNRPSPLLVDYPIYCSAKAEPTLKNPAAGLEYYQEDSPLPILPQEQRGYGSHVLATQAKCAFQAFATHRLRLSDPEPLSDGLSAKTRGIVLHRVLELFWQTGGSLDALPSLIEQVLMQVLPPTFPKDLYELEQNRLETLVNAALTWERTRPAFNIEALEAQRHLTLGPLQFNLRLDRIDRLNSGEQWVIDYKTSIPSPLPWNSETPLEPQLLMYALIDPSVQAILFQELKKGKLRIKGISAQSYEDQPLSTLKTPWETLKTQWRDYLTQLATQFHEGQCAPKPVMDNLCVNCAQQNLCRKPFKI